MTKADKLEKKQDKRHIKALKKDKEFQEIMKELSRVKCYSL